MRSIVVPLAHAPAFATHGELALTLLGLVTTSIYLRQLRRKQEFGTG